MIWAAIACFGLAAVLGAMLANGRLKSKPLPANVALAHGVLAGAGAVLLVVLALQGWLAGLGVVALVIFGGAALGGVMLFSSRSRPGGVPRPLLFGHAGAAATALVLLLVYIL
jgi:hypothetical protein